MGEGVIFAIVPACGHSKRMGRPKLSLPLGKRTVIEHVVTALHGGGVDHVLVVIGPHIPELVPLVIQAKAEPFVLPEATPDMRTTVTHGLNWLATHFAPSSSDAWLLVPGDHPTLDPITVRTVCSAHHVLRPKPGAVVPVCNGRRGHPVLIDWSLTPSLLSFPTDQGINSFLRSRDVETFEVAVTNSTLDDIDTPEDYQRMMAIFGHTI
jgi:molybdenum cofactor cytidylyltransferase